jgi:hypothetical protein
MIPPSMWTLVVHDLRDWVGRPLVRWCVALAVVLVGITASAAGGHGASLFRAVLGGPVVGVLNGQIQEGPDWTWFLTSVLFVVASLGLIDTEPAWLGLTLVRGVSRSRWAIGRLGALAVGALSFLAVLVLLLGIAVATGWRPGPLLTGASVWDVGLWALGLISLGWCALAIALALGSVWPAWTLTLLVLAVGRFGGPLSPYIPFAQWMAGLHALPGTLSVGAGALYVAVVSAIAGVVVLWAARTRLLDPAS